MAQDDRALRFLDAQEGAAYRRDPLDKLRRVRRRVGGLGAVMWVRGGEERRVISPWSLPRSTTVYGRLCPAHGVGS